MNVHAILAAWLEHGDRYNKPATQRVARTHVRHIEDALAEDQPNSTVLLADRIVDQRTRAGATPPSINGTLTALQAAMRHAGHDVKLRKLKVGRKIPDVLTPVEQEKLLKVAMRRPILYLAVLLALDAGLRKAEIGNLRRMDVKLSPGVIQVRGHSGWTPKSYHEREVPMTCRLRKVLDASICLESTDFVVGPQWLGDVPGLFQLLNIQRSGGRRPGLHMLRRTWATRLAVVTDLETLRALAGWSSMQVAANYVATNTERKVGAIHALGT